MIRRKTPKMYILISFIMTMNFAGHCRKGWEDFVGTGDIFVVGDISHKECFRCKKIFLTKKVPFPIFNLALFR